MVRKSAGSKGKKALGGSIFDVKFEVVLIIILIVVAIMLVCFINKKFSKEQFYVSMIKEHMYSEANPLDAPQTPNSSPNTQQLPEHYEGYDLTGSGLPSTIDELTGRHAFVLLGPSWCGHSQNYLRERHVDFVSALSNVNKQHLLHAIDVDIKNNPVIEEIKTRSNVNALPSLFLFENGEFMKVELNVGLVVNHLSQ